MELLARTDADLTGRAAGQHGLRQILHVEGRDFADKGLAALCFRKGFDDELDTLFQTDPEASHAVIGNRKFRHALLDQALEERNDGSAASRHISVADDGEGDVLFARIGIGGNEQFVRNQLGSAVEVDRIHGLVRGKGHDLLHAAVQAGIDHVLRAVDIGLDGFRRIVLTGGHLLECSRVDYIVHVLQCALQTLLIAHIADKEPQLLRVILEEFIVRHHELLEFIPGINNDFPRAVILQHIFGEAFSERTRSAGNQNGPVIQ